MNAEPETATRRVGSTDEAPWERLAKIRLLIIPATVGPLIVPTVIVFLLAGARPGNGGFLAMLIVIASWPVAIGGLLALDWLDWRATQHRVTYTHFELRSGIVWRKRQSIARERIRSVDVSANPFYRIFGLSIVRIGTGESVGAMEDSELKLDGVTKFQVDGLRRQLLRRGPPTSTSTAGASAEIRPEVPGDVAGTELARMQRSWLRFAPLTLSVVFLISGGLLGAGGQTLPDIWTLLAPFLGDAVDLVGSIWLLATAALLTALLIGFLGSVVLFIEAWSNFRLTREPGGTLRVQRGLLTTRSMSLEESRLRGAEVVEPLLVRWARGGRVNAVATGLSSKEEANKAADRKALLPPAPRAEAYRVAATVIGDSALESLRLTGHPRVALRRRLVWALTPAVLGIAAFAVLGYVFRWMPDWVWTIGLLSLPIAAAAALDAFRALGHGLSPEHLVTRHGTGIRRTIALRRDGIIGWNVTRSPFQRRAGIATLTATTAAGSGAYKVRDTTVHEAVTFAEEAVPELLRPFLQNKDPEKSPST